MDDYTWKRELKSHTKLAVSMTIDESPVWRDIVGDHEVPYL